MHPLKLAQASQEIGIPMLMAVSPGTALAGAAAKFGLSCRLIKMNRYVDFLGIWRMAKLINREKIDLIHAHLARDLWKVVPAARLSRRKPRVIWTNHMGTRRSKKDPINKWVYSHLDLAMPVSDDAYKKMIGALSIVPERVRRVYLGIDMERFSPRSYNRATCRRALGIFGDEIVIGIVGQVEPGKGQREFLESAQLLMDKFPSARFIISGRFQPEHEEYARDLKRMVSSPALKRRVFLLGHRDDVEMIYRALDIFVMASHGETFGLVLPEAMAMGVAVIATDAKGVPEIIQNGHTGLLVPPKNSKVLAEAIAQLVENPRLRERLAKEGQKFSRENFDWKRYLVDMKEIYREMAGFPPLPVPLV